MLNVTYMIMKMNSKKETYVSPECHLFITCLSLPILSGSITEGYVEDTESEWILSE